ncbi:MAG: tRNA pseudouridine(38-40) synthase TruA [Gammaproteobacteria bacterium]|jgi:tRNA pseudouridine38-40 synthase
MRILLSIEYDGKNYYGWQEQKDPNTIQGKIQEAIFKFSQENIKLFVAGRTDAGVHATGQIAHFDSQVSRSEDSWLFGLNTYLPEDIKIKFVKFVDDDFHARFSAINRTYRYVIYNNKVKPCIYRNKVAWYYLKNLDEYKMQKAAKSLIGEMDFSCFRSANCQSNSPVRKINKIVVSRENDFIYIDFNANSFLYNMVRNIVGSLVLVGSGEKSISWLKNLLISKNRNIAGKQFPSKGLYLVSIEYDMKYNLDKDIYFPKFI